MVSVLPEMDRLLLVAASKVATVVPVAVLSTMSPTPRCTASLKVTTILLPMATLEASSSGLKVVAVGGVVSVGAADNTCKAT